MKFDDFSKQVSKIKNLTLPGASSHYKMAPVERVQELKAIKARKTTPKKAGVMALFYSDVDDYTRLLLILRKTYQGVHSNQIGFPGGKVERSDADLLATALRETEEEVGANPIHIHVVRSLTRIYIPPSNFEVQPYIGLYDKKAPFKIQETEVEALVEVPLTDFMDDSKVVNQRLTTSYSKQQIAVPAYKLNGYTVWGATAMMLSEIKELFKQVL
ncbi:MAG: CoA pyrophosphatase [Bacteroidota bacterium]